MVAKSYATPEMGLEGNVVASWFVKDESTFFGCGLLDAFRERFPQSVELVKQMDFESDTIFQYLVHHKRLNPKRLTEFVQADVLSHWLLYELASFEQKVKPGCLPPPHHSLLPAEAQATAKSPIKRSKRTAAKPPVLRKSKRIKAVTAKRKKRPSPSTKSRCSLSKQRVTKKGKTKSKAAPKKASSKKKAKKTISKKVKNVKIKTVGKIANIPKPKLPAKVSKKRKEKPKTEIKKVHHIIRSKVPAKASKKSKKEKPKTEINEIEEGRTIKMESFAGCTGYIKALPNNHVDEPSVMIKQTPGELENYKKPVAIKLKLPPQVIPIDKAPPRALEKAGMGSYKTSLLYSQVEEMMHSKMKSLWELDSDRDLMRQKFERIQACLKAKVNELDAMESSWRSVLQNKHKEEVELLKKKSEAQEARWKELATLSKTQKKEIDDLKDRLKKKEEETSHLKALLIKEKKDQTYKRSQKSRSIAVITNCIPGEEAVKKNPQMNGAAKLASVDIVSRKDSIRPKGPQEKVKKVNSMNDLSSLALVHSSSIKEVKVESAEKNSDSGTAPAKSPKMNDSQIQQMVVSKTQRLKWIHNSETTTKSVGTQTTKLNIVTREGLKKKLAEQALLVEKARGKELEKLAEAQKKQINRLKTQIQGDKKENRTRSKGSQTPTFSTRHPRSVKILPKKVNLRWCALKSKSTTTSPDEPESSKQRPSGWRIPHKAKTIPVSVRLKRNRASEQGRSEAGNEKSDSAAQPSKKKCSFKRPISTCLNLADFSPSKKANPFMSTWINPKFAFINNDEVPSKSNLHIVASKNGARRKQGVIESVSVEVRRIKRIGDPGDFGFVPQELRDQNRRVYSDRADQPRNNEFSRDNVLRTRHSTSPRLNKRRRTEPEYREGDGRRARHLMKWPKARRPERRRNLSYHMAVVDDDSMEEGECPFYGNSEPGFRKERSIARLDRWPTTEQRQETISRGFKKGFSPYNPSQCNDHYLSRRYARSRMRESDQLYRCGCDDIRCYSRCSCCNNGSKIIY